MQTEASKGCSFSSSSQSDLYFVGILIFDMVKYIKIVCHFNAFKYMAAACFLKPSLAIFLAT
jgi:hypothetical protein